MPYKILTILFIYFFSLTSFGAEKLTIIVGSKRFTENYIVAEIFSQLLEKEPNIEVIRKFGMGGTMITYNALKAGEIHVYPEYTGTLASAVVKTGERDFNKLNASLYKDGLTSRINAQKKFFLSHETISSPLISHLKTLEIENVIEVSFHGYHHHQVKCIYYHCSQ